MYLFIKSIFKSILPKSFIEKNESFFRGIVARRYAGDQYECNICNIKLRSWVMLDGGDLLCPNCGSLGRTRRLYSLLVEDELSRKRILHFSPPKSLRNSIMKLAPSEYITSDYESEFEADEKFDITQIAMIDENVELIICYHVLEHIVEDRVAMSELYRILALGGQVYIQTPFQKDSTLEDPSHTSEEDRLIHYGQKDHVRIYNADDLCSRLELIGFEVKKMIFEEERTNYHGYKTEEIVIKAEKPDILFKMAN